MTYDRKVLYTISSIAFAVLLACFFVGVGDGKILTACLIVPLTVATCLFIKKRGSLSIHNREVLLLTVVIAALYVIITQFLGFYFGYNTNPYFITASIFFKNILPVAVIIIGSEIIRYVLLAQKNKYADVMSYLICVIADVLTFSNMIGITTFNKFMDLVGLTIFPTISAKIFNHYSSKRFGILPNIAFRLITTLYSYFFHSIVAMSDAMFACIKIFLPIVMLMLVSALYEKKNKKYAHRGQKLSVISMILSFVVVISVSMLISCQFRFGALVIATDSMTGEINKGDMIIYERYDDQTI